MVGLAVSTFNFFLNKPLELFQNPLYWATKANYFEETPKNDLIYYREL